MAIMPLQLPSSQAFTPDITPSLANLVNTINQGQHRQEMRQALSQLGNGPNGQLDPMPLLRSGDMSLMNLGATLLNSQTANARDARNFAFQQQEAQRAQGNADRMFNHLQSSRYEEPATIKTLRAAGIDPASPEGRKALFPRTDMPISATDKRAIFKAEDEIPQLQGTIENLDRALELNDKTFSGFGAGIRGDIASKLPASIAPRGALETAEWQKIMGPEALQAMAGTLKGATTDFELRKFMEMLGDPATPAPVRKGVIDRMKRLTERKLELEQSRINDLRGGSYFREGGGASGVRQSPGSRANAITQEQYQALPPGTPYTAPDGSQRIKR